jgi:hypothetical protein
MNELRKADPLAYLRYASIFNNFTSVVEFIDEIKSFEDNLLGIDFNNSQLALNSSLKFSNFYIVKLYIV